MATRTRTNQEIIDELYQDYDDAFDQRAEQSYNDDQWGINQEI
jgi:hypothetical protein